MGVRYAAKGGWLILKGNAGVGLRLTAGKRNFQRLDRRILLFWALALILSVLATSLVPGPLYAQGEGPGPTEVLQQGSDVPFEVCFEDDPWTRPTLEEQRQRVWSDPRYASAGEAYLASHPLWTDDFLQYPGGADAHGTMKRLGGLWSADFTSRGDGLCRQRHHDVSIGRQAEIWLKYHRAVSLRRLESSYVLVVEPREQGFQVVDFLRPDRCPITIFFLTPGGEEIHRLTEGRESPWGDICPSPSELPVTGVSEQHQTDAWPFLGFVLVLSGASMAIYLRLASNRMEEKGGQSTRL